MYLFFFMNLISKGFFSLWLYGVMYLWVYWCVVWIKLNLVELQSDDVFPSSFPFRRNFCSSLGVEAIAVGLTKSIAHVLGRAASSYYINNSHTNSGVLVIKSLPKEREDKTCPNMLQTCKIKNATFQKAANTLWPPIYTKHHFLFYHNKENITDIIWKSKSKSCFYEYRT